MRLLPAALLLVAALSISNRAFAQSREQALASAKLAVQFLTDQVADHGGYLWTYSADLQLREGEGVVKTATAWTQPPGTPTIGSAFVRLYTATGDLQFLMAARLAAESLRQGQMRSGGWQAQIEFEPERRRKWAYRTEPYSAKRKDQSSLDDDKTQSAIRFLIELDDACNQTDPTVHEMVVFALDGMLSKGQFASGAFPQVWTSDAHNRPTAPDHASYPDEWPREYPGHNEYWYQATLNDNLAPTVLDTLLLAHKTYDDSRYIDAAKRLGDFLIAAQLPSPQPAWAQQYNDHLHPIWARKFEPPAVTGGESQGVIDALMRLYVATGNKKYLAPVPRALDYLTKSTLPDGTLARFYELRTNRPLFFSREYKLTYDDSDVPTHYSFRVPSKLKRLRIRFEALSGASADQARNASAKPRRIGDTTIQTILDTQDARGAWVTSSAMRYHKHTGSSISMRETAKNLTLLASYLADK
ncbi:MAG: pectate lyase [Aureliella sp.]